MTNLINKKPYIIFPIIFGVFAFGFVFQIHKAEAAANTIKLDYD